MNSIWTDAQIEAVAEAIYTSGWSEGEAPWDVLDHISDEMGRKDEYRRYARAALEAAAAPPYATPYETIARYLDDHYLPHSAQVVRDHALEVS